MIFANGTTNLRLLILAILMISELSAARYEAKSAVDDGIGIYTLRDTTTDVVVRIAPSLGANAYSMKVKGQEILFSPYEKLSQLKAKPTLLGTPFLAPWANRLDHDGFYANGKHYALDPAVGNYRLDGSKQPIHGLLNYASEWKMIGIYDGPDEAWYTFRLEFFRIPAYMAQWPFAHMIYITYRLKEGNLEVRTEITNLAFEAMPLVIGYHPYYQLTDAPRDEWKVTLPAREHVKLNEKLTPTGEREANPYLSPVTLRGKQLDDVFTGLAANAVFSVEGKRQKIEVVYGPKYPVAVVYAPPGRNFICFEPMTGITNGANLAHAGKYPELQSIPAGGVWQESFWVKPSGF